MDNTLRKGEKLRLPVKEIRIENKRTFCIVIYEEKEYPVVMFEFQKEDPKPDEMTCVVKSVTNGVPYFIQDFSLLYRRFYTEGNIYSFQVRRDYSGLAVGYYELADWHGFVFRLMYHKGMLLHEGERIRCRVKSLVENRLVLELVDEEEVQCRQSIYDIDGLLDELELTPSMRRWVNRYILLDPVIKDFRETFRNDVEGWLLQVVQVIDDNIDGWVRPGNRRNREYLCAFHHFCLYLLEGSGFLTAYAEPERRKCQKMLSRAAQNAESYVKAIRLIESNEHIAHIDSILDKMKKSGYLFKPDKRLHELMCIFSLEQGLMEERMQMVFDIILDGDKVSWRNEPFRSAFIDMLDLYITATRKKIDRMANIEDAEGRQYLERMIQALAIQLLLATEKDDLDRQLNLSMLYRYLTYVEGGKKEVLLEKSFACLAETSVGGLCFGWNEVRDLNLLAIRMSSTLQDAPVYKGSLVQVYQGSKAQLVLEDGSVQIQPMERMAQPVPAIPGWLLPGNRVQIMVGSSLHTPATSVTNLLEYRKWWKSVERNLFDGHPVRKNLRNRKFTPDKGTVVDIRITGYDPQDNSLLTCTVEDEAYFGDGVISMKDFVRYNIHMDLKAFVNNEDKPFLLPAKVTGTDKNGRLVFSMTEQINGYITQCLSVGDVARCIVMEKYRNMYLCVAEYGFSVQIPITSGMPVLNLGEHVEVNISRVFTTGIAEGEFVRHILDGFTVQDAFADLIYSYSEERVYEEAEEKEEVHQEILLDESYILEMVHLMDRRAVLDSDYIRTYNYLNLARIMAMLIARMDLADYYDERMNLLQMLQEFAINGRVDADMLVEKSRSNMDMFRNYPLLRTRLLELQCISSLDCEAQNPFLWNIVTTAQNERLRQIAQLVLSYNMLTGFGLHEERETLHNKLNEILKIEIRTERPRYFGREDQHTEFKTSLVYPADNNMKPDRDEQTHRIMKVICGFLNAEGGTLYIGVNNEGVACGIDADLPFFKNGSLDSFDLHVRNQVVHTMGVDANAHITVEYPESGKRTVYAMHIQPSPYPVKLDGVYYVRQGSSTWPVMGTDLELFIQRKEAERQQAGITDGQSAEVPAIEASQVDGTKGKSAPSVYDYSDNNRVATSVIRQNIVNPWEDGYGEETRCFLHFLPKGEYLTTEDEWWDETLLTLAILNHEVSGYIVLVYKSGRIIRVPVSELLDKTCRKVYKRNSDDELIFACPANVDDALLMIVKDGNDHTCYRLDDVEKLRIGNMSDKGEPLTDLYLKEVVACDIIPKQHIPDFKKIHNLRETNLGNQLTEEWAPREMAALRKFGIVR